MRFAGARSARRLAALVAAGALACAGGPRPVRYGDEDCAFCRMTITDPRFGAEAVTATGKVQTFDAIECLASYVLAAADGGGVRTAWVSDFQHPGTLLPADRARYVTGITRVGSPMGRAVAALAPDVDVAAAARTLGGQPATWADILRLVRQRVDSTAASAALPPGPAGAGRPAGAPAPPALVVSPDGPLPRLSAAIARARDGDTIIVRAGVYRDSTIVVDKRLTIIGAGDAVLDGASRFQIMTVTADDVTIRGLHFRHVGASDVEDRAAVKVVRAKGCVIADNTIDDAIFGIYLSASRDCRVTGNRIRGHAAGEVLSGNGIHLWSVDSTLIEGNTITGHRDGLYFEFVTHTVVRHNDSEDNLRYGLHFMYSDDCRYVENRFRHNRAGVAVMFTHRVAMEGNRFLDSWGAASYGLLLKEIFDSRLEGNVFAGNTVGLVADGANRLVADHNEFRGNGWAVKLLANTEDGRFTANDFIGNTFDVSLASAETSTTFAGNYWDDYRGYDLNRDGTGDVPFHPVRLFSLIVAHNPPALILLRSVFVGALDAAERVLPALTPSAVVDGRPAMHPVQ